MTEFGMVTQVHEKHISRGSTTSPLKGAGSQHSPNFWDPYLRPNGLTRSDDIWYDNTFGE